MSRLFTSFHSLLAILRGREPPHTIVNVTEFNHFTLSHYDLPVPCPTLKAFDVPGTRYLRLARSYQTGFPPVIHLALNWRTPRFYYPKKLDIILITSQTISVTTEHPAFKTFAKAVLVELTSGIDAIAFPIPAPKPAK